MRLNPQSEVFCRFKLANRYLKEAYRHRDFRMSVAS